MPVDKPFIPSACLIIQVCKSEMEWLIEVSTIIDCVCPGDTVTVTYECTVTGGQGETTVWKGGAFHCPSNKHEIELLHSRFTSESEDEAFGYCNDGAIVGRGLRVENNSYTSQLNVKLWQLSHYHHPHHCHLY